MILKVLDQLFAGSARLDDDALEGFFAVLKQLQAPVCPDAQVNNIDLTGNIVERGQLLAYALDLIALLQTIVAVAEGNGSPTEISYEELFKPYAQFGLTYDASKNELTYNGKAVRWFEDYYTVENGIQAGNDFFNENGVVDVYAVRDLTSIVRAEDGSFDPSGKLTGVKEFSAEEFAARDIEAIKNPPPAVALTGDPPSAKELEDMAKEYEAFGVTYDIKNDQQGIEEIQAAPSLTRRDKERACKLYLICKDMDGLDRVRFNGLDYRVLRTEYARRLPLVAGCLLHEPIQELLHMDA